MGDVIEFPTRDPSFEDIRAWIVKTCTTGGLTTQQAEEVAEAYRPIHQDLFLDREKAKLTISAEAALTPQQAAEVIPAFQRILTGRMVRAAHVIIGLLAREKLHS